MEINVYTDGGARGNPGIAGYGLVIYGENSDIIYKQAKYLGIKTNNEAEYMALIGALDWIVNNKDIHNITKINFYSDSQLLVRQIQGIYRVKAQNLIPLFTQVRRYLSDSKLPYQFKDVRREFNKFADELANQAMDQKC